jgi:hypothetical protein
MPLTAEVRLLLTRAKIPVSDHQRYGEALEKEGFTSPYMFAELDEADLELCGITLKAHVKMLLKVAKLEEQSSKAPGSPVLPTMKLRCFECGTVVDLPEGVEMLKCACGTHLARNMQDAAPPLVSKSPETPNLQQQTMQQEVARPTTPTVILPNVQEDATPAPKPNRAASGLYTSGPKCLAAYFIVSIVLGWWAALQFSLSTGMPCGGASYFPHCLSIFRFNCSINGVASHHSCITISEAPVSLYSVGYQDASFGSVGLVWRCANGIPNARDFNATCHSYPLDEGAFSLSLQYRDAVSGHDYVCAYINSVGNGDPSTEADFSLTIQALSDCYSAFAKESLVVLIAFFILAVSIPLACEILLTCCSSYHTSLTPWRAENKKSRFLLCTTTITAIWKIVISIYILYRPGGLVLSAALAQILAANIAFGLGDCIWPLMHLTRCSSASKKLLPWGVRWASRWWPVSCGEPFSSVSLGAPNSPAPDRLQSRFSTSRATSAAKSSTLTVHQLA